MAGDTGAMRWAGVGLALSSGIALVTSFLFGSTYGAWAASDPALEITIIGWAEELLDDALSRGWAWSIEMSAIAAFAVASVVLMTGAEGGVRVLPRRAAWASLATGGILHAVALSVMLGSYPAAAREAQANPVLLEAATGIVSVLTTASTILVLAGLAALLGAEARVGGLVSRQLGWIGVAICLIGTALVLAGSLGVAPRLAAVPLLLLSRLLLVIVGFRLGRGAGVPHVGG